jgi:hypothetical protein
MAPTAECNLVRDRMCDMKALSRRLSGAFCAGKLVVTYTLASEGEREFEAHTNYTFFFLIAILSSSVISFFDGSWLCNAIISGSGLLDYMCTMRSLTTVSAISRT